MIPKNLANNPPLLHCPTCQSRPQCPLCQARVQSSAAVASSLPRPANAEARDDEDEDAEYEYTDDDCNEDECTEDGDSEDGVAEDEDREWETEEMVHQSRMLQARRVMLDEQEEQAGLDIRKRAQNAHDQLELCEGICILQKRNQALKMKREDSQREEWARESVIHPALRFLT
jgi:hypothetical protein